VNSVFNLIEFADRCDGCGQAGADFGPMLHDHIWWQSAEPGERTLDATLPAVFQRSALVAPSLEKIAATLALL
jgi:hypothetical protein